MSEYRIVQQKVQWTFWWIQHAEVANLPVQVASAAAFPPVPATKSDSKSETITSSVWLDLFMKLGIFGSENSWYVDELSRVGRERGHDVLPLLFEEFAAFVGTGELRLVCGDVELTELDAVLVRTMPPGTLEQVVARMDLLSGLQARGVHIVNPPKALECAVDKYLTTQRLSLAGLPVPATAVCESSEAALAAFEQLGRDVVVKPIFGAEGRGIMRVSDPEIGLRVFRTLERLGAVLYVQQFIHGPGFDVRVLVLDGQLVAAMKRTPRPGEFRANISQQGTGTSHLPTEQELQLAFAAARVTDSLFAGVDIMYDQQLSPLIVEVNAVPGWRGLQQVCDVNVPDRLFQWLEKTVIERTPRENLTLPKAHCQ